jgi:GTP-binding protein
MKRPIITIIGRPNTGKSTLFNRLVGRRMAIVENIPGVTRDRNYAECDYQGRACTLVDTGGLDPTATAGMIAQIKAQTRQAIEEADALIVVFDGREGVVALDEEIVSLLRKLPQPVFYAVNKIDTPKAEPLLSDFYRLGVKPLLPISAEQGIGVDELMEAVLAALPMRPSEPVVEETEGAVLPRIAVLGRPNVGKSTFINRLLGEERMITDAAPGTTRDAIDSLVRQAGRSYLFVDTAGIRRRGRIERGVERYSISRALSAIERSDIVVVLMDAVEGIVEQDTKIVGRVLEAQKGCILVVNKCDLVEKDPEARPKIAGGLQRKLSFIQYAPVVFISALKGFQPKKVFKLIDEVMAAYTRRIPTGELNRAFEKALAEKPPPSSKGKLTKLFYITQAGVKPPTFVIFANRPEQVKAPYRRYLENFLRGRFNFAGVPLNIQFRPRR